MAPVGQLIAVSVIAILEFNWRWKAGAMKGSPAVRCTKMMADCSTGLITVVVMSPKTPTNHPRASVGRTSMATVRRDARWWVSIWRSVSPGGFMRVGLLSKFGAVGCEVGCEASRDHKRYVFRRENKLEGWGGPEVEQSSRVSTRGCTPSSCTLV